MKRQIALAQLHTFTSPFTTPAAAAPGQSLSARLSAAIDRLILGLAIMAPPDSVVLNMAYAEAMVDVFDEWFALNGLKDGTGGLR
jgi:hypothetical protein